MSCSALSRMPCISKTVGPSWGSVYPRGELGWAAMYGGREDGRLEKDLEDNRWVTRELKEEFGEFVGSSQTVHGTDWRSKTAAAKWIKLEKRRDYLIPFVFVFL